MEIIVFRHGIALTPEQAQQLGLSDAERPLSDEGVSRTRIAAAGLRTQLNAAPLDAIACSTYSRAQQTADILVDYLGGPPVFECTALAPDADVKKLDEWLHTQPPHTRLLVVGHEPHLSRWTSWSLTRKTERLLSFEKAGGCLVEFPGPAEGGTGSLRWLLTASQLQALA